MTDLESIRFIDTGVRGGLVSLLLFTAAYLLSEHARSQGARLGAAFGVSVAAFVVQSAPGFLAGAAWWRAPVSGMSAGNAILFWLFARALFDDEFRFRAWHAFVWASLVCVGFANCLLPADQLEFNPDFVSLGLTLAPPLFAVLAITQSLASWSSDLIEKRRRLRVFIVVAGAAYSIVITLAKFSTRDGAISAWIPLSESIALWFIVSIIAWQLIRDGGAELFGTSVRRLWPIIDPVFEVSPRQPATSQVNLAGGSTSAQGGPGGGAGVAPDAGVVGTGFASAAPRAEPDPSPGQVRGPIDQTLLEALREIMTVEHIYRQEQLSIGALARRLDVPEYKLRRLINQGLGYRNFNSFLNDYRIAAVKAGLGDATRRDVSILTLALDAGFQSLGPFNRAFKSATGLTPSEFRRRARADRTTDPRVRLADSEIS